MSAKALDLVDWGKMRCNFLGNAGHSFPGLNAAFSNMAAIQRRLGDHLAERVGDILAEVNDFLFATPKKRPSEGG